MPSIEIAVAPISASLCISDQQHFAEDLASVLSNVLACSVTCVLDVTLQESRIVSAQDIDINQQTLQEFIKNYVGVWCDDQITGEADDDLDPAAMLQQFVEGTKETIKQHGHAVVATAHDDHPIAYTIGLSSTCGFELFLSGVKAEYAGSIINAAVRECQQTGFVEGAVLQTTVERYVMLLRRCSDEIVNLTAPAELVMQNNCKFLQLCVCDKQGFFEWEQQFDHEYMDERTLSFAINQRFVSDDELAAVLQHRQLLSATLQ